MAVLHERIRSKEPSHRAAVVARAKLVQSGFWAAFFGGELVNSILDRGIDGPGNLNSPLVIGAN